MPEPRLRVDLDALRILARQIAERYPGIKAVVGMSPELELELTRLDAKLPDVAAGMMAHAQAELSEQFRGALDVLAKDLLRFVGDMTRASRTPTRKLLKGKKRRRRR